MSSCEGEQPPKRKISIKSIIYFIIVDIIIFLILVLEDYYIGSRGRARLEPYSPSSFEDIINNIHISVIISTVLTSLAFWGYYLGKKSKD